MKVEPLSNESKEYIKTFAYKSTDDSIVYNYLISPGLNKCMFLVPRWVAPNLITLLSLMFNIISFFLTAFTVGWDFTKKLPPTVTLIQGLAHFSYVILDNMDGKQARRTGTSTPFGMLLDHGCDVFTNIIVCFNVCHLLCLSQETIYPLLCFMGLFTGFFATTHEGFVLGELHFSHINGADEGNVVVASGAIIGWLFGNDIWTTKVAFLSSIMAITVGELIISLISLSAFFTIIQSLNRIRQQKGFGRLAYALTQEWLLFYCIIIVPVAYYFFAYSFYKKYFCGMMIPLSVLFARLVIDMQIRLTVKLELPVTKDRYVVLANILFFISLGVPFDIARLVIMNVANALMAFELTLIIILRGNEIMDTLGIKLLTIDTKDKKQ